MGQSRDGGYMQKAALTDEQKTLLNQLLQQAAPNLQQAAGGFSQFLPGGGGGEALTNQANRNFQQQTIPSILNAFGTNSKSSSALNQALAAGGANLNTDLAAMLSQLQLQSASGLGQLGLGQAGLGAQTPQFAYLQKQQPFWQSALLGGISAGADVWGSYLGRRQ